MVFCKRNRPDAVSSITISCGSIGLDGAEPMFTKKDPFDRRILRICAAHLAHQFKYDCRSCRSAYRLEPIPRLCGGEVTTRSILSCVSRDIPSMQSSPRSSNLVID